MTLSKKNLNQLKTFLKNNNSSNHNFSNKITNTKTNHFSKSNSTKADHPNEIFYSIIDNSDQLEDTTLSNNKLKESEEKLIIEKKYHTMNNSINSPSNSQLSEEDLLYDEFNYLLDEE